MPPSRRALTALASLAMVAALVAPASAAGPTLAKGVAHPDRVSMPGGIVSKMPALLSARGPKSVFVEVAGQSAADAYAAAQARGKAAAGNASKAATASTRKTASAVMAALKAEDKAARRLFTTTNLLPGFGVRADAAALRVIALRTDVVAIRTLVPKTVDNAHAGALTRVIDAWQDLGTTGEGVRVGIVDTGIDYTHANFGGPGTPAAYDAVDRTDATGVFPTAKVVGGTDLAGEDYQANSDSSLFQPVPHPDDNPLDCDNHGSHVAGTAAGFGVNADGSTFTGDYSALTTDDTAAMKIGPGMAPDALLWAIKVFGCPGGGGAGSTFLTGAGIDWAMDPNQDGNVADHLDLVNVSIGGDYGSPDDPESLIVRNANLHGMLTVISMGNAGDNYDIGGSPGNTPEALTVASSRDSFELLDAAEATAPAEVAGMYAGQYSVALDYDGVDVTAPVTTLVDDTAGNQDGCDPIETDLTGKIAWLEWDDNDATRQCGSAVRSNNATDAGAVGAVFTSTLDHFSAGITGSATVPVLQFNRASTDALRASAEAGTLVVRLAGELRQAFQNIDPDIEDTPSDFTSRGTRTPGVKPDVSAPGDTIVSTGRGTGTGSLQISGTSMASPHVAGIAALVRGLHPTWTPADVKAAIMGTAIHDLYQLGQTNPRYAPNRVGTGRVDARAALGNEVLAFDKDAPSIVSIGFGVVEVSDAMMSLSKTIRLKNTGDTAATYNVAYEALTTQPGASYSVSPSSVTVPAHGTADVTVTLDLVRNSLRKSIDPTMSKTDPLFGLPRDYLADTSGRVTFAPTAGADVPLRVAVYAAPKPVAAITVPSTLNVPSNGSAVLAMSGRGLAQGSLGTNAYLSLMSAYELGQTSKRLSDCATKPAQPKGCAINGTARGGDIRYVGASSTAPWEKANGDPDNAMLSFGFAMWDNWYNIGSNEIPFVDIYTDADAVPDFEMFLTRLDGSDMLLVETVDLATGDLADLELANNITSNIDTNVFDTNVISLPVLVSALGIDPAGASHRIRYVAGVVGFYSPPGTSLIDITSGKIGYDPLKPGLWVEGAGDPGPLFVAANGAGLLVHRDDASLAADKSNSLLLLQYHNASGSRAQVVTVTP